MRNKWGSQLRKGTRITGSVKLISPTYDSVDIRKTSRSPIVRVSKTLKPFFLYMATLRRFSVSRNTGIDLSFIL